jgi:hypothetical protein
VVPRQTGGLQRFFGKYWCINLWILAALRAPVLLTSKRGAARLPSNHCFSNLNN